MNNPNKHKLEITDYLKRFDENIAPSCQFQMCPNAPNTSTHSSIKLSI